METGKAAAEGCFLGLGIIYRATKRYYRRIICKCVFRAFKVHSQINMKKTLNNWLIVPILFFSTTNWHHNLTDAEQIARQEHKNILLNFSGSDWCGPCMRMHSEIFESDVFRQMADTELVLLNADFPRKKKNQLSDEQQKLNDEMADKYNVQGKFPYTLLLSADGKILHVWEGLPDESAEKFTFELLQLINPNQ